MARTKKAWINGLFLIVTLGFNALGSLGIINGLSQKQVSDMFLTLITPSPSTFSIWSIIYTLLIISMIVMIVKKDDTYYQDAIDEITDLFRISCLLNIIWIVAFSYVQIELSTLFILAFVLVLAMICTKLKNIQRDKRLLLPLTFGLYTGWLFIASVVNIAASLVKLEWNGFGIGEEIWAVITLVVAIFLIFLVLRKIKNAAFPLPVAWAYYGIYKFLNSPEGFNGDFPLLQNTTLVGIAILLIMAGFQLYQNSFAVLPNSLESRR